MRVWVKLEKQYMSMEKPNRLPVTKIQGESYEKSLSEIIRKVEESKHKAITTVNKLLIELYWFIGKTIVNLQERGKWGDGVVEKLSYDLRTKYPDQNGFSVRNLWNMKRFCETYRHDEKLQTLSAEISWSHNVLILDKTMTIESKEFYLKTPIPENQFLHSPLIDF